MRLETRARRWLEALCLGTPLLLALSAALTAQLGGEVNWRTEAGLTVLALAAVAFLWRASWVLPLPEVARALTWAGVLLLGQTLLSLGLEVADMAGTLPDASPVALALGGGLSALFSLLPGLGLLALGAVLREVAALIYDEELTV